LNGELSLFSEANPKRQIFQNSGALVLGDKLGL
jgi:hypothetical protein